MLLKKQIYRGTILLLLGIGGWQVMSSMYMEAKAMLAQYLLMDAWHTTKSGQERVRPWPWADTWPLAKMNVERLGEEVIVLAGSSGRTLAFGPGNVEGTARPGEFGNVVISGHRDTHFTFIKSLQHGDPIELHLPGGQAIRYAVLEMAVVDKSETWVLDRQSDQLTLITCYPFDAVNPGGRQRFIVIARPISEAGLADRKEIKI